MLNTHSIIGYCDHHNSEKNNLVEMERKFTLCHKRLETIEGVQGQLAPPTALKLREVKS